MGLGTMESVLCVFSPVNLANTSAGAGYVGLGTLSACLTCMRDGCCDACRPMFSSEIFSAGFLGVSGPCRDHCCDACCDASTLRFVEALPLYERLGHTPGMLGVKGLCRDLCCDDGCDDVSLRLVEALPLFQRLGHTVLGFMEGFAAIVYKLSEAALLGWGSRENTRLLMMFEVASLAWSMQNSPGTGNSVSRTLCLEELVPDGTSLPSHVLSPASPPDLPRRPDGLPWAPRCTPEEWTAWCRVRDGLDQSNDFFEVVQIEPEVEEVFDLAGLLSLRGGTRLSSCTLCLSSGRRRACSTAGSTMI